MSSSGDEGRGGIHVGLEESAKILSLGGWWVTVSGRDSKRFAKMVVLIWVQMGPSTTVHPQLVGIVLSGFRL